MTTLSTPQTVQTSFEYPGSDDTAQVSIVGSWDQWSNKTPMQRQPNTNLWQIDLKLTPGPVTFKFVRNGEWVTASTYDVVGDGFGGVNNSRIISIPIDNTLVNGDGEHIPASDEKSSKDTSDAKEGKPKGLGHEEKEKQEENNCLIC